MKKIALRHAFEALDEYWDQHVLEEANGILIKIAKGVGATGWHSHDDQDETFLVYRGELTVEVRGGRSVTLRSGELVVVPRGVEHRVRADAPAEFLLLGRSITSTPEGGKPRWSGMLPRGTPPVAQGAGGNARNPHEDAAFGFPEHAPQARPVGRPG